MSGENSGEDVLGEMREEGGVPTMGRHQRSESFMSDGSESTTDISEHETDFAKQLKRQRRQVLDPNAKKEKQDFSAMLQTHRKELKSEWGDEESESAVPEEVQSGGINETFESQGDMFGDFSGFSDASATVSQAGDAPESDVGGPTDEDFGDFETSALAPTDDVPNESDDADFGDFEKSAPAPTGTNDATNDSNDADFSDVETSAPAPTEDIPNNSNDADFGAFEMSDPLPADDDPNKNNDADFGEFETSAPAPSHDASNDCEDGDFETPATTPVDSVPNESKDADFGDFEASAPTPSNDVPNDSTDHADFGDFEKSAAAVTDINDSDDADFGDFETSASATTDDIPIESNNEKSVPVSDFGCFGAAASAISNTDEDVKDSSDFGKFETTLPLKDENEAQNNNTAAHFDVIETSATLSAGDHQNGSNGADFDAIETSDPVSNVDVDGDQERKDDGSGEPIAAAIVEAEDQEEAEQEMEKMEDSSQHLINPHFEKSSEPLSSTGAAEDSSIPEETECGTFDQAPVDADKDDTKKLSVADELAALKNRSLTKNFTEKLRDAGGLSTPEQEEASLQKTSHTNRAPIYKKEATESLKVGTTAMDQDLAFKQKQTAQKKIDMQKKEEAVQNLTSFKTATVATNPIIPDTSFDSPDSTSDPQEKEAKVDDEFSMFKEATTERTEGVVKDGMKDGTHEVDDDSQGSGSAARHEPTQDAQQHDGEQNSDFNAFEEAPAATNETMASGELDKFRDLSTQAKSEESTEDDFGGSSQPVDSQAGDNGQSSSPVDWVSNTLEPMELRTFESTASSLGHDFVNDADGPSGPTAEPRSSQDTDEFGDFESTSATPEAGESADQAAGGSGTFDSSGPAREAVTSQDDEFGTFESSAAAAAAEAGESADEDAGCFGSLESTGPATEHNSQDMDEFGSFESTAQDADGFGSFESTGPGPGTETAEGEMDGFGSFESTGPAPEPVASQDDDDFGNFESSGAEAGETGEQEEDEFGDFEDTMLAAGAGEAGEQDVDEFGDFEDTAQAVEARETSDQQADEFGDFEDTTAAGAGETGEQEVDEFGGFEDTTPAAEAGETSDQQADEFGDFEDTKSATAQATGEDADGFGSFESTGPVAEELIDQNDDDFGNFDSAPAAATLPPKTADGSNGTNGGSDPVDDEFGDFGDFDDAPAHPNGTQPVASAKSSAVNNGTKPAPATSSMLNGVFDLDRVRPVFTSLQSKYPFDQITDGEIDSSLFVSNSLESYLKSVQVEMNGKENDSSKLVLSKDFLGDAAEASVSKLVIKNDGRGPYHNFMAPLGGILQYSKNIDVVLRDNKAAPIVYKSEPNRAPSTSTTNKSASQASNSKTSPSAAGGQSKTPAAPMATRVAIPPKEKASEPKSAGDLASRIPDLSFMMKSHLVVPKK